MPRRKIGGFASVVANSTLAVSLLVSFRQLEV